MEKLCSRNEKTRDGIGKREACFRRQYKRTRQVCSYCPVSCYISAIYDFSPKAAGVGKNLEVIECQSFKEQTARLPLVSGAFIGFSLQNRAIPYHKTPSWWHGTMKIALPRHETPLRWHGEGYWNIDILGWFCLFRTQRLCTANTSDYFLYTMVPLGCTANGHGYYSR